MPTKKLKIDGGLEYSPTTGIDSGVKLHNFTVGTDGSIYKLPIFKNIKNARRSHAMGSGGPSDGVYFLSRFIDITKFGVTALDDKGSVDFPAGFKAEKQFYNLNLFRRLVFLTTTTYGVLNVDYDGNIIFNDSIPDDKRVEYSNFERYVYQFKPDKGEDFEFDLTPVNSRILVDFNAQYDGDSVASSKPIRAIFPMQRMVKSKAATGYSLLIQPRNMISCQIHAQDPDVKYLQLPSKKKTIYRDKNDLAKGAFILGNRMIFYSAQDNAIYFSDKNNFSTIFADPTTSKNPVALKVRPAEEIQAMEVFNGNIIVFTPSGMERWAIDPQSEIKMITRDPTFHISHRVRFTGSMVIGGDGKLYYYTDDFHVYRLNSEFKSEQLIDGSLPEYKPIQEFLLKNNDLPMAAFKMLGWHFVSIGPWLYNIDSGTWSTYSIDGWKNVDLDNPDRGYIWENTTTKRTVCCGIDDVICTYNTACRALSYKEMQDVDLSDQPGPCLNEGKYQWGDIAFFTTRVFQDEQPMDLCGGFVYVRGIIPRGAKIWIKVIPGASDGDFDINDEKTFGIVSEYSPIKGVYGNDDRVVGKFSWRFNITIDRFRFQFVTKETKGFIIQSVFANIYTTSDSGIKVEQPVNIHKEEEKQEK